MSNKDKPKSINYYPHRTLGRIIEITGSIIYAAGFICSLILAVSLYQLFSAPEYDKNTFSYLSVVIILIFTAALIAAGQKLSSLGKRLKSKAAAARITDLLSKTDFHPVLYLRSYEGNKLSFQTPVTNYDDISLETLTTEEEQLVKAVKNIERMLTIGIPQKDFEASGAKRMYTGDDTWQSVVEKIMNKSRLIIVKVTDNQGFFSEIGHILRNAQPEQIIFLMPNNKALYERFSQHLSVYVNHSIPEYILGSSIGVPISGILYFTAGWIPHFVEMKEFPARRSIFSPLLPSIKLAMKPVYKQLGIKWRKPHISSGKLLLTAVLALLTILLFIFPLSMDVQSPQEKTALLIFLIFPLFLIGIFIYLFYDFIRQERAIRDYEAEILEDMKHDPEIYDKTADSYIRKKLKEGFKTAVMARISPLQISAYSKINKMDYLLNVYGNSYYSYDLQPRIKSEDFWSRVEKVVKSLEGEIFYYDPSASAVVFCVYKKQSVKKIYSMALRLISSDTGIYNVRIDCITKKTGLFNKDYPEKLVKKFISRLNIEE